MKRLLKLSEAQALFGGNCRCYEMARSYHVTEYMSGRPNITYVIGKEFELDEQSNPIKPTQYIHNDAITSQLPIFASNFTSVGFLYGYFYLGKRKNAPHFNLRTASPDRARHLLIHVIRTFKDPTGYISIQQAKDLGAAWFSQRKSITKHGVFEEIWVFPVSLINQQTLYRCKLELNTTAAQRDKDCRRYLALISASRQARWKYRPKLERVRQQLMNASHEAHVPLASPIILHDEYFSIDLGEGLRYPRLLYNTEDYGKAKRAFAEYTSRLLEREAQRTAKNKHVRRFLEMKQNIERLGLQLDVSDERYAIVTDAHGHVHRYNYSATGLSRLHTFIKGYDVAQKEQASHGVMYKAFVAAGYDFST